MSPIAPILPGEFLQMLQRCMPPGGWPTKIAVANSGGPDSVCLLYMLHSVIANAKDSGRKEDLPEELVSIHVNHALQNSSRDMVECAEEAANSLGVASVTTVIPWSVNPFPPRPPPSSLEGIARDARYYQLHRTMTTLQLTALATAHHADDQVETSIIRIANGSSPYGAAAMRPIRRMGMGNTPQLQWIGLKGMGRWMVRPLLEVPKDRILKTCEDNQLHYVNDPTNFQPEITLRNWVRELLAQRTGESLESDMTDAVVPPSPSFSPVGQSTRIIRAIRQLESYSSVQNYRDRLRDAVKSLGRRVELIDKLVTSHLETCVLPSPPSTLLIDTDRLASVTEPSIRTALVRRILRYVSPHPWGSISAEADGNSFALDRIATIIWSPPADNYRSYSLNSLVLAMPVAICSDGSIKKRYRGPDERYGLLFHREPQRAAPWLYNAKRYNPLERNVTGLLQSTIDGLKKSILYDCRFLVTFDVHNVPSDVRASLDAGKCKIMLAPATEWQLPTVIWQQLGAPHETLADWDSAGAVKQRRPDEVPWVHMQFVRTLAAI